MIATRGLAITGLRVIQDDELFREVRILPNFAFFQELNGIRL